MLSYLTCPQAELSQKWSAQRSSTQLGPYVYFSGVFTNEAVLRINQPVEQ
jgi:hypothetical protein